MEQTTKGTNFDGCGEHWLGKGFATAAVDLQGLEYHCLRTTLQINILG